MQHELLSNCLSPAISSSEPPSTYFSFLSFLTCRSVLGAHLAFFFPENKVFCYLICQEAKHESQELLCLLLRAAGLSLAGKWCTGGRGRARRQQVALLFVPHPWSLQDPSSESSGPSPAELVEPNAECPHLILAKTQTPH